MLTEGSAGWSGRENIFSLENSGLPLGVECKACRHCALVPLKRLLRQRGVHLMTQLTSLRLRCTCGSRGWTPTVFRGGDDIEDWIGRSLEPTF
ncbi:MAG: hypothetical protein U1E23_14950 [Reyranellaceae bacterium]